MDRFTIQAAEAGVPRPAIRRAPTRCCSSSSTGSRPRSRRTPRPSRRSAAPPARSRCARRATTPSARCSGAAGRARSPRWVASRPTTTCRTGSCPRTKLPEVLRRIDELSEEHGLRVGNVFHAGDGNLHPLVLYDATVDGEYERAKALAEAILAACVDAGGSLTGEHGIGVDKACAMPSMFSERDLEAFERAAARVRPGRAREPRQGAPDAAALRRGARPLPRPPAGAARPGGALLMRPTSLEEAAAFSPRRPPPVAACASAPTSTPTGSLACSSTRPATSPARSRPGSGSRRSRTALAARRSALSLDPPGDPSSAPASPAGSPGRSRHRFGTPRDLVLGVTLVLGDGTIASSGGKVVKNVAGYDLGKLVCGSEGRLALIARVSLRLHPLPQSAATLVVETDDTAGVVRELGRLAARAERARRPPPRPGRAALRGLGARRRGSSSTRRARSSAASRATARSGRSRASARARRSGALRFVPADLAQHAHDARRGRRPALRGHRLRARTASAACRRRPRGGSTARSRSDSTRPACSRDPGAHRGPASTAASACRPARRTSSGARRWTRRAGGSS